MAAGKEPNIIAKLKKDKRRGMVVPLLLEFYERLLRIQSRAEQRLNVFKPGVSAEDIRERLSQRLPLLKFDELNIEWSLFQNTLAKVIDAFAAYPDLFGKMPDSATELATNPTLARETARAWFEEGRLPSALKINDARVALIENVIQAALKPFFINCSRSMIDFVEQEGWRRGYCPVCGGNPDFAFLREEQGTRWLVCSRCDARWLFQRLKCPYCETEDQYALSYFTDDSETYRLYVCNKCKHYLKAIDLRKSKAELVMPLERLFTLDMDKQAHEYGYIP